MGHSLLAGSSSSLLQLSITNVPVVFGQKPNFLPAFVHVVPDGTVSSQGFREGRPTPLLLVVIAMKHKTNIEHPVGSLEVGNYPTGVGKLVGWKLPEAFLPLEGDAAYNKQGIVHPIFWIQ